MSANMRILAMLKVPKLLSDVLSFYMRHKILEDKNW